jgi:hypothetical protein
MIASFPYEIDAIECRIPGQKPGDSVCRPYGVPWVLPRTGVDAASGGLRKHPRKRPSKRRNQSILAGNVLAIRMLRGSDPRSGLMPSSFASGNGDRATPYAYCVVFRGPDPGWEEALRAEAAKAPWKRASTRRIRSIVAGNIRAIRLLRGSDPDRTNKPEATKTPSEMSI